MNDKKNSSSSDPTPEDLRKKKKRKKLKRRGTAGKRTAPASVVPAGKDPEVTTMIKKLRDMDDDLQTRMNRVAELSGMSPVEVRRFIDNPSNFPPKEWSRMQRKKESLEKRIYEGIGIEYQKRIMKKKKKKIEKGRRGKTLGARKGWIQM